MTKKQKKSKKSLFNSALAKLVAVSLVIGCVVIIVATEKDCAEKEQELTLLQNKTDTLNADNAELQRKLDRISYVVDDLNGLQNNLNSDEISDFYEEIAIEKYGYAYPDERRFYDTSRD